MDMAVDDWRCPVLPAKESLAQLLPVPHSLRRGQQGFGSSEWQNDEKGRVGEKEGNDRGSRAGLALGGGS